MKLIVLYRPKSEHSTPVESFVRDLQHQHEVEGKIDMVGVETREGATMAALYDVWDYPTLIVISDDGSVMNMWQGEPLPLMDEVAGYLYA
jgi:hypothetical protein